MAGRQSALRDFCAADVKRDLAGFEVKLAPFQPKKFVAARSDPTRRDDKWAEPVVPNVALDHFGESFEQAFELVVLKKDASCVLHCDRREHRELCDLPVLVAQPKHPAQNGHLLPDRRWLCTFRTPP